LARVGTKTAVYSRSRNGIPHELAPDLDEGSTHTRIGLLVEDVGEETETRRDEERRGREDLGITTLWRWRCLAENDRTARPRTRGRFAMLYWN
jgi:hypothetical protein